MTLIPQGSFPQNDKEVMALLRRKKRKGKLSLLGCEFLISRLKTKKQ